MTLDNFLVRAKRKAVEHFQQADAWERLSGEDRDTFPQADVQRIVQVLNDVRGRAAA